MEHQCKREAVDGTIRDLLIDLAFGYQSIPEPVLAPLREGTWDRFPLHGSSSTFSRHGSALHLVLATDEYDLGELWRMMKVRNQPANLRLQDGSSLGAELTHMANMKPGEAYTELNIQLYQWTWATAVTPHVWVGRLQGKVPELGNLSLIEWKNDRPKVSHRGFRFSGKYTWYILREEKQDVSTVLVDAAGAALERDALREEFHALQFTLGGGLRLDYLTGLDGNRNVVGAMSLGSLERPRSKYRPPVAHRFDEADKWLPEFFRLVALKISQRGAEPLIIAIASYLDSQADHLDGAYLKAHVGLEAFGKRIVAESSPDLLVKDEVEWKKWVSSLLPAIQSRVVGSKQVDVSRQVEIIRNKFVAAMFAPSGDVVRKALQMHGIEVPVDVREEIKKRNYPAHGFLMNKSVDLEIDRDVRRLELIQTLIVALVAVYVGYTGPIHGYNVADDGGRLPPDWWPVRLYDDDVQVQYVCERRVVGGESKPFSGGSPDRLAQLGENNDDGSST